MTKIQPYVTRREMIAGMAAAPVVAMIGCGDDTGVQGKSDTGVAADAGDVLPDLGNEPDAATVADAGEMEADAEGDASVTPTDDWATGGTASIVDRDGYPDPFAMAGATCTLTCAATLGPCHVASPERRDISDGSEGLPVNLHLRIVDGDCDPIADAVVEIWHTNTVGTYSGEIADICNETDEDRAAQFFRGYLRTDADGRVAFDTCYPGWYPGRAVHIHFRVQFGAYDGADNAPSELVSQLFFADELNDEIFDTQPVYSDAGPPDTTFATDGISRDVDPSSNVVMDVARMSDGVMLASATIVIINDESCRL